MTEPKKRGPYPAPPLLPHPLFEAEEPGEEPPAVLRIKVTRWGARGQRWVPQLFDASSLISLEQVQQNWGGGDYELIAYGPGGCVARRRYSLDGRSKPLYQDDDQEVDGAGFGGAPAAVAAAPAAAPSGDGSFVPLLVSMMKISADSQATMIQSLMTVVAAMLTSSREGSAAQVAQMQAMASSHAQQQAALMTAIVGAKNGNGNGAAAQAVELLREGIAIGKTTGGGGDEEGSAVEQLIETVAPFVVGAMQAQAQQPPAPPSAAPAPELEEPEGP